MKTVHCSLVFLIKEKKEKAGKLLSSSICLAMGKMGVSTGFFNGYGGKIEAEDAGDMKQCAVRETRDESGVTLNPANLRYGGTVAFFWPQSNPDIGVSEVKIVNVSMYLTSQWSGHPIETEAFHAAQWFGIDTIPYDRMMEGEKYWLPQVLAGKIVNGSVTYDKDKHAIGHEIYVVAS